MSEFTDRLNHCVDRREYAASKVTPCSMCGTKQVQLLDYLGDYIKFRCRHCKHEWTIEDEWSAS